MKLQSRGRAVPLPIAIGMRGAEGCVNQHIGKHAPATTHPATLPIKKGAKS